MDTSDPREGGQAEEPESTAYGQNVKSGRLRRLLSGGQGDEFTEKVKPLTSEQRAHLTRATDELMKRYSISRTSDGSDPNAVGEPLSADEFGAILETVLVDAFDFGWFDREDLPEAPELTFESDLDVDRRRPPVDDAVIRARNPVTWSDHDPDTDEPGQFEQTATWATETVQQPVFDTEAPLVPDPEIQLERDIETVKAELVEIEAMLEEALIAEREAIVFAAATRDRLEAMQGALANLEARSRRLM
jgi:hypothetical protein